MARKPNYRFARLERERNKAARKAARAKLKAERAELRRQEKAGEQAEGEGADDAADIADEPRFRGGAAESTIDADAKTVGLPFQQPTVLWTTPVRLP